MSGREGGRERATRAYRLRRLKLLEGMETQADNIDMPLSLARHSESRTRRCNEHKQTVRILTILMRCSLRRPPAAGAPKTIVSGHFGAPIFSTHGPLEADA